MRKNTYKIAFFFFFLASFCVTKLFAQAGAIGTHDPGALLKDNGKYWMFATGNGIHVAYSDDLYFWENAQPVFPVGTWPAWINSYVPGFEGHFWAPEAFYMNGQYYLYYSSSTFGSSTSAIGVATSKSLDPQSPDYGWTDQGMVVSSSSRSDVNAIDPAIFQDDDGRVYMTYGSFSGGMGLVELDPVSGKRKEGAAINVVAGGGGRDWEAPYIFKENGYYYFIVNRGFCCRGLESTYRMVMGRSRDIKGPYIDKNGVSLRNEGGSHLLGTIGRYIGPGHFGLYQEDGVDYVSMHFYDKNDNGWAKLDIARLEFDEEGWPVISRNWLAEGTYKVINQNSGLAWTSDGCTGEAGEPLIQEVSGDVACQQWDITPVGNGVYTLKSTITEMALSLTPGATGGTCNTEWGAKLQLTDPRNVNCQKFRVGRTVDGAFIFTSEANNQAIEVPFASTAPGVKLGVWGHNDCTCQRWFVEPVDFKVANISPEDGASFEMSEDITLEWEGSAKSYKVYIGSSVEELELLAADITTTSYTLPDFTAAGEYFWRVDAIVNGNETVGEVWSFNMTGPTAIADFRSGNFNNIVLQVYPNPVEGIATVKFSNLSGSSYSILLYDSSGKLLRTLEKGTTAAKAVNQFDFNTEGYAKGLYRIQMVTNKEVHGLNIFVR